MMKNKINTSVDTDEGSTIERKVFKPTNRRIFYIKWSRKVWIGEKLITGENIFLDLLKIALNLTCSNKELWEIDTLKHPATFIYV